MKKNILAVTTALAVFTGIYNFPVSGDVNAFTMENINGEIVINLNESDDAYTFRWDPRYSYVDFDVSGDKYSYEVSNYITASGAAYTTVRCIDYYDSVLLLSAKTDKGNVIDITFKFKNDILAPPPSGDVTTEVVPHETTSVTSAIMPTETTTSSEPDHCVTTTPECTTAAEYTPTQSQTQTQTNMPVTTPSGISTVTSGTTTAGSTFTGATTKVTTTGFEDIVTTCDITPLVTTTEQTAGNAPSGTTNEITTSEEPDYNEADWFYANDFGDVNSDNIIDLSDLTTLSLHLLKDTTLNKSEFFAADVSYDKKVNVADLAKLRQYLSNSNVILGPEEIIWR